MRKLLFISLLVFILPVQAQYNGVKPILGEQIDWAHPLSTGLVGFWLAGHGGDFKALDLSGNGNHASLVGDTHLVAGKFGAAWLLDATGDYLYPNMGLISGDWTISCWVNGTDVGASIALISGNGVSIKYEQWSNQGVIGITNGGDQVFTTATPFGRWAHIVIVRDGTNSHCYLDGVLDSTIAHVIDLYVNSIGRRDPDNDNFFGGLIDDVKIHNRALTAREIQQLYQEPFCMFRQEEPWKYVATEEAPSGAPQVIITSCLPIVFILVVAASFRLSDRREGT